MSLNFLSLSSHQTSNAFPIFSTSVSPTFYYDPNDAKVVQIAAEAFANDVKLISGKTIQLNTSNKIADQYCIVAGTIGQSALIDELIKNKLIDVANIQSKWEQFSIHIIKRDPKFKDSKSPLRGAGGLIIVGSDRRGTAFGIFHLSRFMGVSPFVWWADVVPAKKKQLFIGGSYTSAAPSVQYRGIFINDEDWGMHPWAAKNMDADINDIGPKTYAKVFELLLRLKANYIWPAMHPCTKAFYYYKQNPQVADDYAIVVGGSHCEPMLRNNVCEWAETYEEEYKKKPGEWRYDLNKDEIYKYWDDRIKESVKYESVFTVGMRGVHDGSMPGPKDPNEKLKLLETVITDQREILQSNFKKPATAIPQIFVPYKEVLSLYRRGMKLPDDVTVIWPDDNYGYIRQLPNEEEQKRSGGHGVYYHLSYWGSPADYLWLSSTSPALIGYEMKKAYDYGAKKLWVFNVGDIKPAELETQFALDMAWDINVYDEKNPSKYIANWVSENFGGYYANKITSIKEKYYQLAQLAKPEHMGFSSFTKNEMRKRLDDYKLLVEEVNTIKNKIPSQLQDAFFELIEYPVHAASLLNHKIILSKIAAFDLKDYKEDSKKYLLYASLAYDSIKAITNHYNKILQSGKWDGMMSYHPRDLKVFDPPVFFDSLKYTIDSNFIRKEIDEKNLVKTITVSQLKDTKSLQHCKILDKIGISGAVIVPSNSGAAISSLQYQLNLPVGNYKILVKCLPTYAMEKDKKLNYSIAVNEEQSQVVNVHSETESTIWKENVLRGFSQGSTNHSVYKDGLSIIKIILQNKNIAISQIEIYKAP